MRPCFKFAAATAEGQPAHLSIDDEIGFWGTQAKDFRAALDAVTASALDVEINSPGGDVFAGLGIYNMLRSFAATGKSVTTRVGGVAASIASVIFLAGDKRVMPSNTFAMVHNPWSFTMGNAEELRQTADTLDKIGTAMQATYVERTGQSEEAIKALLSQDTWISAAEALEKGFATEVSSEISAKAVFSLERADLPEAVSAVFKPKAATTTVTETETEVTTTESTTVTVIESDAPVDPMADQVAALATAAGLGDYAAVFALGATTVAEADTRITAAREIVALCKVAGRPQDASAAIKANKSLADVRAALIQAKADDDQHTDTSKPSQAGTSASSSGVNPQKVWNSHNAQRADKKGRK